MLIKTLPGKNCSFRSTDCINMCVLVERIRKLRSLNANPNLYGICPHRLKDLKISTTSQLI